VGEDDFDNGAIVLSVVGSKWKLIPSYSAAKQSPFLLGIACSRTAKCLAVGATAFGTLVERNF
jgi:hypothetical protein